MTATAVAWVPVTPRFGAEVDIDLNTDLSVAVAEELSRLFDERHLLIFRNQEIEYDAQREVVSIFGNPLTEVKYLSTEHDLHGKELSEPLPPVLSNTAFHQDLTYLPAMPIRGISLYAEDVSGNTSPGFQGTHFVSARSGYLDLPDSARVEMEGRTAIYLYWRGKGIEDHLRLKELPFSEIAPKVSWWAEHPLFYPHPRTGEAVLLYGVLQTHSIVGMSPEDSRKWFEMFESVLYEDTNVYTHRWQQNDLVLWDNIAIAHRKQEFSDVSAPLPTRVLRRVSFGTEEPNLF